MVSFILRLLGRKKKNPKQTKKTQDQHFARKTKKTGWEGVGGEKERKKGIHRGTGEEDKLRGEGPFYHRGSESRRERAHLKIVVVVEGGGDYF